MSRSDWIALAALVVSVGVALWNVHLQRLRRPLLRLHWTGVQHGTKPVADGGWTEDSTITWALDLRLENSGHEVPLTVFETGYRQRGSRQLHLTTYRSGKRFVAASALHRAENQELRLEAGDALTIDVPVSGLCASAKLTGLYARATRNQVAWLPRKDLRRLLAAHSWPASPSTDTQ